MCEEVMSGDGCCVGLPSGDGCCTGLPAGDGCLPSGEGCCGGLPLREECCAGVCIVVVPSICIGVCCVQGFFGGMCCGRFGASST